MISLRPIALLGIWGGLAAGVIGALLMTVLAWWPQGVPAAATGTWEEQLVPVVVDFRRFLYVTVFIYGTPQTKMIKMQNSDVQHLQLVGILLLSSLGVLQCAAPLWWPLVSNTFHLPC